MRGVRTKLTLLCAILFLIAACGPSKPKGEVIVYVAAPLSGFQANGGQTVLGGAHLMAAQLNKAGGLLGYTVNVVGVDDESDSDVAVEVAEQIKADLQAGKKVIGVVGHYNSGQTLAAMEVYKDLPLIVITPTASEISITQKGYTNFFRVNANDVVQARVDAEFLVSELGVRRVAVVYNDDPYGIGLGKLMAENLRNLGAEVPVELQVAVEQSSFAEEVAKIAEADPEAIFYGGYEIEAPYLRAELVEAGLTVPFLASDGAFLAATVDEAAGTADGRHYLLAGQASLELGYRSEAERQLRRAGDIELARTLLGTLAYERGDLEAAEAAYRDAVRLNQFNFTANLHLGYISYHRGRYRDAIDYYRTAHTVDETNPLACLSLAAAFEKANDAVSAVKYYKKGLLLPGTPAAERRKVYLTLARLQYELGRDSEVEITAKRGLAEFPGEGGLYFYWGEGLLRMNHPAAAKEKYKEAARDPLWKDPALKRFHSIP